MKTFELFSKIITFVIFVQQNLCEKTCDECVQSGMDMYFCYKLDYKGERCGELEKLKNCPSDFIEKNSGSFIEVMEDRDFQNFEVVDNVETYIQFKPQRVKLNLRKGDAVNLTFSYKPARNYPLELYYLMDLTYSMKNDLETLVNLGEKLGYSLKNMSENFKIAFGSYVDKPLMPFSLTNKNDIENPCKHSEIGTCAKSYLVKHIQNFTDDLDLFVKEVEKKSETSANLDDLEGGMDALMQIITCGKRIGWSDVSRKFVIVSTGSYMHLAGDGLLSGTVARNTGKCLIDTEGNYPVSDVPYDYPSLGEIHKHLKNHKVNVIFAVKEKVLSYYESMKEVIPDSTFVGILEKDSKNIIQLTRAGYMDFFKKVKFFVDSNHTADLDVKFYANCDGFGYVETSKCSNVFLENVIDFIAEIKLNQFSPDIKNETLYIVEKNIQERIQVDLEYFGLCKCDSFETTEENDKNCINGHSRCGNCICNDGWTGINCNDTCSNSLDPCRQIVNGVKETSCSKRGDCECGKCICDFPYQGKYCEFKCPTNKGKICSNHGKCVEENTCQCDPEYSGEDCSCQVSQENCLIFGKICNDHGICECNKCTSCDISYKGNRCEYYIGKEEIKSFCSEFLDQTLDFVENGTEYSKYKNSSIKHIKVPNDIELGKEGICFARFSKAGNSCDINYTYNLNKQPILLQVQTACITVGLAGFKFSIFMIVAIIIGGLLLIIAWKLYVTRKDKMEYERFEKECMRGSNSKTENPLYTSPITNYTVPFAFNSSGPGKDHSKDN